MATSKTAYVAPVCEKIGDFETTTLSSSGGSNFDSAFYAALSSNPTGLLATLLGPSGLAGLIS